MGGAQGPGYEVRRGVCGLWLYESACGNGKGAPWLLGVLQVGVRVGAQW